MSVFAVLYHFGSLVCFIIVLVVIVVSCIHVFLFVCQTIINHDYFLIYGLIWSFGTTDLGLSFDYYGPFHLCLCMCVCVLLGHLK